MSDFNSNTCSICGRMFKNERGLVIHLSKIHDNEEEENPLPFRCPKCGKGLQTEEDLNSHMSFVHRIKIKRPVRKQVQKTPRAEWNFQYVSEEECREFNKQTFANLIDFYHEELLAVEKGVKPTEIFCHRQITKFKDLNILRSGVGRRVEVGLTPEAREILLNSE